MNDELKPCPFCGGATLSKQSTNNAQGGFYRWIHCDNCGAYGRWVSSDNDPFRAWNARPIEDALRAKNTKLREAMEAIVEIASNLPPFHAYGDNEAAVGMVTSMEEIVEVAEYALEGGSQ